MTTYFTYPSPALQEELHKIAKALSVPGKGILSIDESLNSLSERFDTINLENTEENRRQYRKLILTTEELSKYVSGAVLFHETLYQRSDDGTPFLEILKERGIIPGIKVDKGRVTLFGSEDEFTTQGLDDLGKRCIQYKKDGCHFAKFRSVFNINKNIPSYRAITENANVLGRFASICQEHGMVPIIETSILPDGDYSLERCQKVAETLLGVVIKTLNDYHIFLEGTLLKLNMTTPGKTNGTKTTANEIALATVTCLLRTVPPAVPGILFATSDQTDEEATVNLNVINQCVNTCLCQKKPWSLSFSFGRALQFAALGIWKGKVENTPAAQAAMLKRAKANSQASIGKLTPENRRVSGDASIPNIKNLSF